MRNSPSLQRNMHHRFPFSGKPLKKLNISTRSSTARKRKNTDTSDGRPFLAIAEPGRKDEEAKELVPLGVQVARANVQRAK